MCQLMHDDSLRPPLIKNVQNILLKSGKDYANELFLKSYENNQ